MPEINTKNVVKSLKDDLSKVKSGLQTKPKIVAAEELADQIKMFDNFGNKADAKTFREMRKDLDFTIQFDKPGADLVNNALQRARKEAKDALINASEGTPYAETMKNYSKMLDARESLYKKLGKRSDVREARIESFVGNLFGRYKTAQQDIIKNLDEVFGQNFTEEIKLTTLANEIVKEGKIPFFPTQFTGRSLLGGTVAAGSYMAGGPGAAALPLAMSSPQLASRGLGLSRGMGEMAGNTIGGGMGLAGDIMTNPYLQRTIPGLARIPLQQGLRGEQ